MSSISQITGKKPRVTVVSGQTGKLVLLMSGNGKSRGCMRLSERNVLIGSSPNCTVRLQSPGVKDFQCQIIQGKLQTIVRNLSPDTRLNDQSFTEAWLKPGDRISCGQMDINVLEVGSPNTELPSVTKNEAAGNELPQPTVSREQLQQLKRQAAELRRKLEEDRQRSDLRAEELEANLTASRDHLRYTREQLTALLGAPKMGSQPQPEQAVEPAVQTVAAAQESAAEKENFDWCQNFRAAEACCEGEDFESEAFLESWQLDSLEEPVDAPAETFASVVEEKQDNDECLPVESEVLSSDEDTDPGSSEMAETYQVEYVDSFDETEHCESIDELYEATESLVVYDDNPSPIDETAQETSELRADDAHETTTEFEFVAESLKAWFHQPSANAGLESRPEPPVDRDEVYCELPEELRAAIRECESERFKVEPESEYEVESLPANEESLQVDESNRFEPPSQFVLPETPHIDEQGQEEVQVLASEAQEFVASESEVFEASVSESNDSKASTCDIVEQDEAELSEPEQAGKRRSLVDRFLGLFRKTPESSAQPVEAADEDFHIEPAVASAETEDVEPVESGQLKSESPANEEESHCDEDFDLNADLDEYLAGYQPELPASTPEAEAVAPAKLESASVVAQCEEEDACLKAALTSLSDVPTELGSEAAFDHEPPMEMEQIEEQPLQDAAHALDADFADESADDGFAVKESQANADKELSTLDCDYEDKIEDSDENLLNSMKESNEEVSDLVAEVSGPAVEPVEEVSNCDQIQDVMCHQIPSGPQPSEDVQAESDCEDAGQPVVCASELADDITSEVGLSDSPEIETNSQEEESIEDYMNRLLQRVGTSRQSTKPENRPAAVQQSAVTVQAGEQLPLPRDLLAQTFSQDLESRKRELGPVEISPKSLPALETDHIDQMRLMARESANSAIEASLRRKTATQATTQLGIGCMLLVGGIVQTTLADGLTSASALATIPCYAAALYFFKKYFDWRKSFTSLDSKLANAVKQKQSAVVTDEPHAETEFSAESGS